jgi:hypothetical protein
MTVQIPTGSYVYGVRVMASPWARLLNDTSWQMGSIWATKEEEVLATPRLDGKLSLEEPIERHLKLNTEC